MADNGIFIALVQNAVLLLAMAFLYDVLTSRHRLGPWPLPVQLLVGGVVGGLGIIIMLSPWTYVPGIVFDTRSVLLCISGLFFGTVPTAVAMAMTALFRLSQGGAAAWTGVAVIGTTGAIGILWRHYRRRELAALTWRELYLFGLIAHADMLLLMLILPWPLAGKVLAQITLPVLTIYPLATMFLGLLMVNRLQRENISNELLIKEERLRMALAAANQGLYDLNVQTGEAAVSPEYATMLGYDPAEFHETNANWLERLHPDDQGPVAATYRDYIAGNVPEYRVEFRQRTKSGAWKWLLSLGKIVEYDAAGRPLRMLGTHTDITKRKQTEETIRLFQALVENASDAIGMSTPEGKHYYQNGAFTKLFGAIGEDPPATLYVDQAVGREIFKIIMAGGRWTGEVRMYAQDKSIMDIFLRAYANQDANGRIIALVGAHTDITEQKRVENALKESEQRYRTLIDNMPGLAYRCLNDEYWTMIFFSEGTQAMTGYPASDFIGNAVRSYTSIIHPDDRLLVDQAVQKGVDAHQPYEMEYRLLRADGNIIWVYEKGQGGFDPAGNLLWLDGVIIEITKLRQAEKEKNKLQAQLLQAQKMESVGRLAGGVAHDFNNMLQTILGYCDLALNELTAGNPLKENLVEIRTAARRSADLTRQLLAFARRQTATPKVLDLNDTVGGMLKMLQRLIGENIDLAWMPGHDLWRVKIDPSQLDQILANLAVNSRDAIADTGKITIATENVELDSALCDNHLECVPGDYVMLLVNDTGCGMDQATLTQIFEPFFTTKELGKGTGLGLATVYGIVRQNNGLLTVESSPGHGTTFRIYLPRVAAESADSLPISVAVSPAGGSETILLVEDEEAILKLGKAILVMGGYTVLATSSAQEALRMAQEHAGPIHLLITDVVMPEMNGRDLAQQLRSHRPELCCLYMSGYTADVIARHGVLEEGVSFLQKPFSVHEFSTAVRQVLQNQKKE